MNNFEKQNYDVQSTILNSVTQYYRIPIYMCILNYALFNINFHYSLKQRMKLYINCKIPSSYLQHIRKKNYIYIPNNKSGYYYCCKR